MPRHKWRDRAEFLWRHARYSLWGKWRYGDLLDTEAGEIEKVYFPLDSKDGGPAGEHMWAQKISRDLYRLDNNGFFAHVSKDDVVRVRIKWPYREVIEVVERKRRTVRISFDLPWPDREERKRIGKAVSPHNGELEWGQPNLLSISFPIESDPYQILTDVLGGKARILEVD